jgi:hypothetical protein
LLNRSYKVPGRSHLAITDRQLPLPFPGRIRIAP